MGELTWLDRKVLPLAKWLVASRVRMFFLMFFWISAFVWAPMMAEFNLASEHAPDAFNWLHQFVIDTLGQISMPLRGLIGMAIGVLVQLLAKSLVHAEQKELGEVFK